LLDATGSPVLRLFANPVSRALAALAALYGLPSTNVAGWRFLGAWLVDRSAARIDKVIEGLAAHDAESIRRLKRRKSRHG
jgi:hypothetical protein